MAVDVQAALDKLEETIERHDRFLFQGNGSSPLTVRLDRLESSHRTIRNISIAVLMAVLVDVALKVVP